MTDLLADFTEDCRFRQFSSWRNYYFTARKYLRWLEKNRFAPLEVDEEVLKKYMLYLREERHLKHASIVAEFKVISAFYSFLKHKKLLKENPVIDFRTWNMKQYKAEPPAKRKFLSIEETPGRHPQGRDRYLSEERYAKAKRKLPGAYTSTRRLIFVFGWLRLLEYLSIYFFAQ